MSVKEDNVTEHFLFDGSTVHFGALPSYDLVNARLGLESQSDVWQAAVWGINLTDDELLYSSTSEFLGTISQIANMPRTYGVDLRYNFQAQS